MIDIAQVALLLRPKERGVHLITEEVVSQIPQLERFETGLLSLFLQHTSAALTINENADPDVRRDTGTFIDELIPDSYRNFRHTLEGPDDMPAHLKSMLFGCGLNIPVSKGALALGTWQGIYLIEGRDYGGSRNIVATLFGRVV